MSHATLFAINPTKKLACDRTGASAVRDVFKFDVCYERFVKCVWNYSERYECVEFVVCW
jgi:hypothetical protein